MNEFSFRTPHGAIKITVSQDGNGRQVYLYLDPEGVRPGYVAITSTIAPGVNIDQDADGLVVGVEVIS